MSADFDVAIVGSGFSGSLLAMIARRLDLSVVLIERASHPRFAIGESSTPLANLLLEQIATTYDLPRLRPLCEWGSWQKSYPKVACGLKRGFTFYHHELDKPWARRDHNEFLVAASPYDEVADTHWYRADLDHFLVREAQALGAEYLDNTQITSASQWNGGLRLDGARDGRPIQITARFVVDASGPRGFLHHALRLPANDFPDLPAIEGLYTHFTGVRRWDELFPSTRAPYPADDAAVHHVFPGGWIWVLHFNNGITSAGVAASAESHLASKDGWQQLMKRLPAVQMQFADAAPLTPFVYAPNLPFRSSAVIGPSWALLPSAAGFIDPLLSTGFPLTLLGVQRLGEILTRLENPVEALKHYERKTLAELDRAARLITALYRNMDRPQVFNALTLLYFAAASFIEAAHRLKKSHLVGDTFLLADNLTFSNAFDCCIELALRQADATTVLKHVLTAIEPIDVAGFSDLSRRNAYGVFAADLRNAAHKLQATADEVDTMLARCGFVAK